MTQGEHMRRARKRMGLSIDNLSMMTGIAPATIGALERGTNRSGTIYTIGRLADALGLSIDEYVGHEVVKRNGQAKD